MEFSHRIQKKGYKNITIFPSRHFHPKDRQRFDEFLGNRIFSAENNNFRFYIRIRNEGYIQKRYGSISDIMITLMLNSTYLIYKRNMRKLIIFIDAYFKGIAGYFEDLDNLRKRLGN